MSTLKLRNTLGVVVVLLCFWQGSTAVAASMCSDIFREKSLRGYFAQKTLAKIDFNNPHSETYLNEQVASYYFYKRGDILKVSDLGESSLSRRQMIFARLLERQVMTNGVKFLFQTEWQDLTPSGYRRLLMKWESFRTSLVWQTLTSLPLKLPQLKTAQHSEAVLRDLVLNGQESIYWREGEKIYDATLRQEFYSKLRRVYTVAAYGLVLYMLEDEISDAIDQAEAEQNQRTKEDFMNALDALEQQVKALEQSQ